MAVRNRAGLPPGELEALQAELEPLESLSDVIRWGRSQAPGSVLPPVITDVIVQDEFTHDAIVPWRGRAIVFGST
jgi:hypothetical protein